MMIDINISINMIQLLITMIAIMLKKVCIYPPFSGGKSCTFYIYFV